MRQTILLLSDGTSFPGTAFGTMGKGVEDAPIAEIVFNTSMTGYQEILTDPSYNGQMVLMTYPHIGNYGCEPCFNESGSIKATALVIHSLYDGPLPMGRTSLDSFMKEGHCYGITDVDTRSLTLHLRDHGSQNAMVLTAQEVTPVLLEQAKKRLAAFPSITERNLIEGVSVKEPVNDPYGKPKNTIGRFAVIDFGIKESIIKELNKRGIAVTLLPSTATKEDVIASKSDALFLSNGPGDPALLQDAVAMVRSMIGLMPVMGICLGHQIITWALGGKTVKMKFGHHGANHPVKDSETGKTFVTSQNHGFMSDPASLPPGVSIWFTNANDGSIEGLQEMEKKVASVQFHPEASPGPHDASWIFDRFAEMGATK
jgi:carbamoyl-phosphate synthase small subunit